MPYQDSPGWERQWQTFPWDWDFHVSTVSEGHRVVNDKDKTDAKSKGAKLTFGEVLDCGVGRMLHNLGAAHKRTFHDLGMGPGKMLIQTYLQYENLRTCMGVELAKGRYDLGEKNLHNLLKTGWRGRTFLGIEFKKGEFLKIVEDVPNKAPKNGWNIGDKVVAYFPLFKKDKMMVKDYNGTITDIKKHESNDEKRNTYSIQYNDGTKCDRVQYRYLFIPGTERTCEVWYGSLFDYPGGFQAEICVLETDFPEEMHPHLIECMCTTPIGCTFLTYHDLKKFKCFDWHQLRQIDCNIYDNDRYITSWSQGWRFYIWEHISHFTKTKPYILLSNKGQNRLKINDQILFKLKTDNDLKYGEILTINKNKEEKSDDNDNENENENKNQEINLMIKTNNNNENLTISNTEYEIFRAKHRFRIGEEVSAYYVENEDQYHAKYDIYKAQIISINTHRLSYNIKYTDYARQTKNDVPEKFIYNKPHLHYKPGEQVMACWPRNAQNKNCPHRYKRFPAQVLEINNDSTYKLRYKATPYLLSLLRPQTFPSDYNDDDSESKKQSAYAPTPEHCVAEAVREMWIQYPAKFVLNNIQKIENKIGIPFYTSYTPELVETWNNKNVCQWANDIGVEKLVKLLEINQNINGKILLNIQSTNDQDLRIELNKLFVNKIDCNNDDDNQTNDNKTESVELNNDGLNRIEMRNLLANIKHLKSQHKIYQSQYAGDAAAGGDNEKLQKLWRNWRKEMGGTGGGGGGAPIEDTDTK